MADDVWKGDVLNRRDDANALLQFLLERNERAIKFDIGGVSINLNAPWGAGKTFFVSRFAKQLASDGYKVAFVDAWRDDHAEDPLFAVMSAILSALQLRNKKSTVARALKENAGKIAIRTLRGAAKRVANVVLDKDEVEGILDDVGKSIVGALDESAGAFAEEALASFETGQQAIADFKKNLRKAVENDRPLFVFVDELDRCRPTYGIFLLERMKHLFDVPNVVFVISTNTTQLSHTIRAVYGHDFDAERYLMRFFDRTYTFDTPTMDQFVQVHWETYDFDPGRFMKMWDVGPIDVVSCISKEIGLSLRDAKQSIDILWTFREYLMKDYQYL